MYEIVKKIRKIYNRKASGPNTTMTLVKRTGRAVSEFLFKIGNVRGTASTPQFLMFFASTTVTVCRNRNSMERFAPAIW